MTPCRTEKVDCSKKNRINNRISKKTTRQEESPEKTRKNTQTKNEKTTKQKSKQNQNQKTKPNLHFPQVLLFLFFLFLSSACCFFVCFCSCFFPWFWFSSLFCLFALVLFFGQTLYSLCCWTHNSRAPRCNDFRPKLSTTPQDSEDFVRSRYGHGSVRTPR